jgi:uncharacterized membrane protein YqgA involved in biofilm formation
MLGVIVNALSVVLGSVLGLLVKRVLNDNIRTVISQAIGVSVLCVGVLDMIKTVDILKLVLSFAIGGLIGALLCIGKRMDTFGDFLKRKLAPNSDSPVGEAFVTATLIFCVGGMVVYGSINAGLGNNETLFIKSVMDGFTALVLTATLGWGVMLSSVPIFVIQGLFALFAGTLSPIATPDFISQLSGIGGVMVFAIGINLLEIKKIRVADMLPAILGTFLVLF